MPQYARPEADIEINDWRRHDNGATDLHAAIDEVTLDEADYVISGIGPDEDSYTVRLSDVIDPGNALSHVPRTRIGKQGAGEVDLRIEIFEPNGRLIINGYQAAVGSAPANFNLFLSTEQRNAITDYNDALMKFTRVEPAVWTNLGTDSVIEAESSWSANSAKIRHMTWWDDKLWLGHGDANAGAHAHKLRYWDSADQTIKTLASQPAGQTSDAINDHMIWNDRFWVVYQDPHAEPQYYVVVETDGSATVYTNITETVVHAWQTCVHSDGNAYIAGSGDPPFAGGCVWRSADNGATWTQVFAPNLTNGHWIPSIFSHGGYLWVQIVNALSGGIPVGNSYKSADGLTWADAGFQIGAAATSVPKWTVNFNGYAFIKTGQAGLADNTVGDLLRFDGTGPGMSVAGAHSMGNVYDLSVGADGRLYVLSAGSRIWRSDDGFYFKQVAKAPVNGDSILVVGQSFYFAAGATIYRSTLPNLPALLTAAIVGASAVTATLPTGGAALAAASSGTGAVTSELTVDTGTELTDSAGNQLTDSAGNIIIKG